MARPEAYMGATHASHGLPARATPARRERATRAQQAVLAAVRAGTNPLHALSRIPASHRNLPVSRLSLLVTPCSINQTLASSASPSNQAPVLPNRKLYPQSSISK